MTESMSRIQLKIIHHTKNEEMYNSNEKTRLPIVNKMKQKLKFSDEDFKSANHENPQQWTIDFLETNGKKKRRENVTPNMDD